MSGTPNSAQDRHTLLSVGHQCSEQSCLLVDFLPFKCQHCQQPFCGEHFLPAGHNCPKYDESKYNRVAPACPLCNELIAIPPGQDPNIRMEQHITAQCSVMTGKSGKSRSSPICARGKCGKVLFAPIRCDKCKAQFCPQHRFPKDHGCPSESMMPSSKPAVRSTALANFNSKASAAGASTVDTIKKTLVSASSPSTKSTSNPRTASMKSSPSTIKSSPTTIKSSTTHNNPFSSTDRTSLAILHAITNSDVTSNTNISDAPTSPTVKTKMDPVIDPIRAKAEQASKRRALQERAKKGLLNEEEKANLAALVAAEQNTDKKDCVIM